MQLTMVNSLRGARQVALDAWDATCPRFSRYAPHFIYASLHFWPLCQTGQAEMMSGRHICSTTRYVLVCSRSCTSRLFSLPRTRQRVLARWSYLARSCPRSESAPRNAQKSIGGISSRCYHLHDLEPQAPAIWFIQVRPPATARDRQETGTHDHHKYITK